MKTQVRYLSTVDTISKYNVLSTFCIVAASSRLLLWCTKALPISLYIMFVNHETRQHWCIRCSNVDSIGVGNYTSQIIIKKKYLQNMFGSEAVSYQTRHLQLTLRQIAHLLTICRKEHWITYNAATMMQNRLWMIIIDIVTAAVDESKWKINIYWNFRELRFRVCSKQSHIIIDTQFNYQGK